MINKIIAILLVALLFLLIIFLLYKLCAAESDTVISVLALVTGFMWSKLIDND